MSVYVTKQVVHVARPIASLHRSMKFRRWTPISLKIFHGTLIFLQLKAVFGALSQASETRFDKL